MADPPIRRVRFSTESYLSLIVDTARGSLGPGKKEPIIGGLQGKREGDLVYVINTIPGPSGGKGRGRAGEGGGERGEEGGGAGEGEGGGERGEEGGRGRGEEGGGSPLKGLIRNLKERLKKGSGMEIVGWYSSSPGMDLSGTDVMRHQHDAFGTTFPGSFLLLVDPRSMERNTRLQDYLGIYRGAIDDIPGDHGPSEAPDIEVDLDLSKIVRRVLGMVGGGKVNAVSEGKTAALKKKPMRDGAEKKDVTKGKKTPAGSTDPVVMIDRMSGDILRLKGYLAKLKRESVRKEHKDRTWFTRRIRFLKVKQLDLFDDINTQISRTADIQMRIAFYKVRDSLAQDMKLLDDLISEQYLETLTDLVRMGAEKTD